MAREVVSSVTNSGDSVLLHIPSGTYLGLDRSAARIVELLNQDPDPGYAASVLSERFGIPLTRVGRADTGEGVKVMKVGASIQVPSLFRHF